MRKSSIVEGPNFVSPPAKWPHMRLLETYIRFNMTVAVQVVTSQNRTSADTLCVHSPFNLSRLCIVHERITIQTEIHVDGSIAVL